MLPQTHRLRQEKDIQTLFAKGKSVFGIFVHVRFRKNNLTVSRFAVVAGTKMSKKAVVRNRSKRQIRAIIQKHIHEISSGFDVAFLIQKEAIGKNYQELEIEVIKLLEKAKLLV